MGADPNTTGTTPTQPTLNFNAATDPDEQAQLERDEARFFIARQREILERAGEHPHDMRAPCPHCGCTLGVLTVISGQNSIRCAKCERHAYNAPKTETGQTQRSVRTLRQTIKPSQQARILDRDHGRCLLCGTTDDLTIGHLLSISDGHLLGALESELCHDANLAAMCEACNSGLGRRSISTRTYLIIQLHILQAEIRRAGPNP